MPYAVEADAIVGIGNDYTLGTWGEDSNAARYPFNNSGFPDTRFIFESKDFGKARGNFLFFASGSQVQKGLDLLLEIFPQLPDLDLYICSSYRKEPDFCACYHKELFETPNIHPMGRIAVNGPEFYELAARCAYIIHPWCSDGQAGSVVQCMHAGLIPLVTREVGVDTEDFGGTFADDSLDEIEKVIVQVASLPETWHQQHSLQTRKIAEEKYSEAAFMKRWREILTEVLPSGD
jgi:glycosyltransferase involved in cell wall biosynthesis